MKRIRQINKIDKLLDKQIARIEQDYPMRKLNKMELKIQKEFRKLERIKEEENGI